ncbi:hypothetical protein MTR67_025625 [Solanum verrucosum]|uniref:Integrase core domain containing protein n=1 Tax=Solanum verrucosum TaxID=315347 RepID=A0AAF0R0I1_SOLVR|nr:hypothetical protein MTR67_025625 [Solanum verrucosum]
MYPEVWNTIKFHKFKLFTKPRGSYISTWVREFYSTHGELAPKGKKWACVSVVTKTDVEVASTSSTDIRWIEVEYMRDDSDRRKSTPTDTYPVVYVEMLPTEAILSPQASEPTGTPGTSTFVPSVLTTAPLPTTSIASNSQPPTTQAMCYKIGHLAQFTDRHASKIGDAVMALKANIVRLRKYVDELKSTDLSMLFGMIEIPEIPSADVPANFKIPLATTTGDVSLDAVDADSEAETDEEELVFFI